MIIKYNKNAAFAERMLNENVDVVAKETERLSTGYRINRSADDAAGLTISEKMRWQVRGLNRASTNIQEGISVTQVADGALQEVHELLQRMNELVVQGANDSNTEADRQAIQEEINQIKLEIERISDDTEFNELKLFKPTEIPQISGSPTDILVYHEDYNGTVREGGIIYKGRRYSYDELGLPEDSVGNILKGDYNVTVVGENGDDIGIHLMFDGGNRTPSGREYELKPDKDGVRIDGILHTWESMKGETEFPLTFLMYKGEDIPFSMQA